MGLGAFQSTARQRAPGLGRRAYGHPLPDYPARDQASRPDPLVHHGLRASPFFVIGMSITYAQINNGYPDVSIEVWSVAAIGSNYGVQTKRIDKINGRVPSVCIEISIAPDHPN